MLALTSALQGCFELTQPEILELNIALTIDVAFWAASTQAEHPGRLPQQKS
jgi:hypothetical protein